MLFTLLCTIYCPLISVYSVLGINTGKASFGATGLNRLQKSLRRRKHYRIQVSNNFN